MNILLKKIALQLLSFKKSDNVLKPTKTMCIESVKSFYLKMHITQLTQNPSLF